MSAPTFATARMVERMVDRKDELNTLKEAICQSGEDTRLVIIKGRGGLGKTRLLAETLRQARHPDMLPGRASSSQTEPWIPSTYPVIISDVLDLSDVHLHTSSNFIQALRTGLAWHEAGQFPAYDAAVADHRRKRADQVHYSIVKAAAEKAEQAFFEDYEALTKEYRLVWVLDTAEQLGYIGAPWLWDKGILRSSDVHYSTQQRLLEWLQVGKLPNTTIILAGRPEAEPYFKQLQVVARKKRIKIADAKLDTFKLEDTRQYLRQLAQDYSEQTDADEEVITTLQLIAKDADWAEVLQLYTGGQPVRLALFVDVLVEGKRMPAALQDSYEEAQKRLKWNKKTNRPNYKILNKFQQEIEAEFINLIFAKTEDLRARILTALARAKRGLDVERLTFILGSRPGTEAKGWVADPKLREEIEWELSEDNPYSLRRLSFIKNRADKRLILQDELYRLYDQHMAANDTVRERETLARLQLYQQLQSYAKGEISRLVKLWAHNRAEQERSLHWESPARALAMKFRYLGGMEEQERIELEEQVREANLERLHYQLRVNPVTAFNARYLELSEERSLANDEETDFELQLELWRFLNDEAARPFVKLSEPDAERSRTWAALERAAIQDEVARWIKRFFFRGQYARAVEFAEQVEAAIPALPEPIQKTLLHPFSVAERTCWREMARFYLAQDVPDALSRLEIAIRQAERLLQEEPREIADHGLRGHPAEPRLWRVVGIMYNNLGYGYTTLGNYRQAIQFYTTSLRYLRRTDFRAQQAVTRNNLSRVLSEMGLINRAVRMCRDALELKERQLADEDQLAWSHNTLAVIYNNGRRPENAWPEAVKALVYFRKTETPRGIGLALLELAEALRRLVPTKGPEIADTPEDLFNTADAALAEALEIFHPEHPEVMRRIEVLIEQGCLYRDYMRYLETKTPEQENRIRQYRNRALRSLKEALELAKTKGFLPLQLDAQGDLVWTYYYAGEVEAADESIDELLRLIPENSLIQEGLPLPDSKRVGPHIFKQLGKVMTVRGRLRLDKFIDLEKKIRASIDKQTERDILDDPVVVESLKQRGRLAVRNDPEAQMLLNQAADAFVLTLGYNRLYSDSTTVSALSMDVIYDYLRTFNEIEMEDFFKYQRLARRKYRIDEIEPEDVTDLEIFLRQSFGDYFSDIMSRQ